MTTLDDTQLAAFLEAIDRAGEIRRTRHALKQLERNAEFKNLVAEHQAHGAALAEESRGLDALRAEMRTLEAEAADRTAKITLMEEKLASGEGLTSRDLVTLQGDIATAKDALGALEETELELMDRIEAAETALARRQEAIAGIGSAGTTLKETIAAEDTRLKGELAEQEADFARVVGTLPEPVAAEVLRRAGEGEVPAALVAAGSCGACGSPLGAEALGALKAPGERVVGRCEDCEALLVLA